MKTSVIALAALVSGAVAIDKPSFLNSDINPEEGSPFTFKYNNCPDGCTISVQSTPGKDLETITAKATGSSFTWTPSGLSSGTYNFYIVNNDDKTLFNYSKQFQYTGTGSSTSAASSTAASTTGASSSTAASSASTSGASSSTTKKESSSSTSASKTQSTAAASTSKSSPAATTTAPGNAGNAVSFSPIALIGGAVAAMLFLN